MNINRAHCLHTVWFKGKSWETIKTKMILFPFRGQRWVRTPDGSIFFKLSGRILGIPNTAEESKNHAFCNGSWKVWNSEGKWRVVFFLKMALCASLELDNASSRGIHSYNWFSTRDPNTASQWQADNSANFSLHSLWMALYDRLVECDWWLGFNNGTVNPPPSIHTHTHTHTHKHTKAMHWHKKHFQTTRQKKHQSIRGSDLCKHSGRTSWKTNKLTLEIFNRNGDGLRRSASAWAEVGLSE